MTLSHFASVEDIRIFVQRVSNSPLRLWTCCLATLAVIVTKPGTLHIFYHTLYAKNDFSLGILCLR